MKSNNLCRIAVVLVSASLIILAGCVGTSAPTRFYLLNPVGKEKAEMQITDGDQCIAIGIGPVMLPTYLDRPQIVVRVSENELRLAEFDQWAEPLKENLSSVLAENLSRLLPTQRIAVFPWPGTTKVDFQVIVEVIRLDSDQEAKVLLETRWSLLNHEDKNLLLVKRSSFIETAGSQDYEALVAAQSRAVFSLTLEIAEAIKALAQKGLLR